jgi:hypothetical protein
MSDEENFDCQRIEEAGISVEFYRGWPVESIIEPDRGNIYQRIADTGGFVFVRYGENETVPEFMKTLTDLITTVSVISDEVTMLAGNPARHLTLTQKRSDIGVHLPQDSSTYAHEHFPEVQNVLSVFSFNSQGTSVLVGYRLPEKNFNSYHSIVERIIQSVDACSDD